MNRAIVFFFAGLIAASVASGIRAEETTDQFGRFGKINLYYPSPHPAHVALFVSGDGGWNLGVVDMARELAALNALVVGVDITYYLKQLESAAEPCVYPAADFELLSKYFCKSKETRYSQIYLLNMGIRHADQTKTMFYHHYYCFTAVDVSYIRRRAADGS